jgi:hypothetical protein
VLTEDDHFDYLVGIALNKNDIPSRVRLALNDSLLLFLGFPIDHWSFRGLVRCLPQLGEKGRQVRHFAVQVNPQRTRFATAEAARQYLEETFAVREVKVKVLWQSAREFVAQLARRWERWQTTRVRK